MEETPMPTNKTQGESPKTSVNNTQKDNKNTTNHPNQKLLTNIDWYTEPI